MTDASTDVLIIGGGVIGLSLAYELARNDVRVCVLDRREFGREASWAGAGIIPFGSRYTAHPAAESLAALSRALFPAYIQQLQDESGIDNGWSVCGGIYLTAGLTDSQHRHMIDTFERWQTQGAHCEPVNPAGLTALEPTIASCDLLRQPTESVVWHLPHEAQIRNPRYLKGLLVACARRGVRLVSHAAVHDFLTSNGRIEGVYTAQGVYSAAHVCLTSGCWTGQLADRLGMQCRVKPIRGQIALLQLPGGERPGKFVLHQNDLYVVSRGDGLVLVGATVEDVGYRKATTADGIGRLLSFAGRIGLADAEVVQCWAGLRPAPVDDLPYIGQLPGFENGWIAAGHFRAGLQMSPATAVVLGSMLRGIEPPLDATPFAVERLPISIPGRTMSAVLR